ncbi:MAG: DUF5615 family PIN-like protein [Pirellulales bacterium]|nr:DUF5615 family PIN-like protein [Pirellulales bacterium]
MARLFADENFPRPVVEALRNLGHDVETIHATGAAEMAASDRDVLAIATASKRAVLTSIVGTSLPCTKAVSNMLESLSVRQTQISRDKLHESTSPSENWIRLSVAWCETIGHHLEPM